MDDGSADADSDTDTNKREMRKRRDRSEMTDHAFLCIANPNRRRLLYSGIPEVHGKRKEQIWENYQGNY